MPIGIHCLCGRQMRVPDEYAGKRVKCPACGEPQTVAAPPMADPCDMPLAPGADLDPSAPATASPTRATEIDLGGGVIFWCDGPDTEPKTGRRLYYGTVGATPEFNSHVIERLMAGLPESMESQITSLVCPSSDWESIEFIEDRRDWLLERLRAIVAQESPDRRHPAEVAADYWRRWFAGII